MSEVNRISSVNQNKVNHLNTAKTSAGKASFSSYLGESKTLDEIFEGAAQKYNVPVNLLKAVGKAESGFDADAVSRCGAQGIMQLMPATAASLGVEDSFDAEQNIMGGAKYIAGLLKKYDGNTTLALAAYNAGSGNVAKYGGVPPFQETQNYVVKVLNYMKQGVSTDGATVSVAADMASQTSGSAAGTSATDTAPAGTIAYVRSRVAELQSNLYEESNPLSQQLDTLFSYDDYLKFLDEFTSQEEKKEDDENDNSNYFASKNIQINAPVMNLLNQIS